MKDAATDANDDALPMPLPDLGAAIALVERARAHGRDVAVERSDGMVSFRHDGSQEPPSGARDGSAWRELAGAAFEASGRPAVRGRGVLPAALPGRPGPSGVASASLAVAMRGPAVSFAPGRRRPSVVGSCGRRWLALGAARAASDGHAALVGELASRAMTPSFEMPLGSDGPLALAGIRRIEDGLHLDHADVEDAAASFGLRVMPRLGRDGDVGSIDHLAGIGGAVVVLRDGRRLGVEGRDAARLEMLRSALFDERAFWRCYGSATPDEAGDGLSTGERRLWLDLRTRMDEQVAASCGAWRRAVRDAERRSGGTLAEVVSILAAQTVASAGERPFLMACARRRDAAALLRREIGMASDERGGVERLRASLGWAAWPRSFEPLRALPGFLARQRTGLGSAGA